MINVFVILKVKTVSHDIAQLTKLLQTVQALVSNQSLYLEPKPYVSISGNVCAYTGASQTPLDTLCISSFENVWACSGVSNSTGAHRVLCISRSEMFGHVLGYQTALGHIVYCVLVDLKCLGMYLGIINNIGAYCILCVRDDC